MEIEMDLVTGPIVAHHKYDELVNFLGKSRVESNQFKVFVAKYYTPFSYAGSYDKSKCITDVYFSIAPDALERIGGTSNIVFGTINGWSSTKWDKLQREDECIRQIIFTEISRFYYRVGFPPAYISSIRLYSDDTNQPYKEWWILPEMKPMVNAIAIRNRIVWNIKRLEIEGNTNPRIKELAAKLKTMILADTDLDESHVGLLMQIIADELTSVR